MRKIFISILSCILLLSLSVCVSAEEAFLYEDTASGAQLLLPDGWDLEYEEDALVKVTFVPGDTPSALMQYGSADLWSGLESESRQKAPRNSYDNRHYSTSDVAELVGCNKKDVKRITLNGTEYYRASFQKNVTSGKFTVLLDMTYWVRYDNGWVYVYQYVGDSSNTLYDQFRDILVNAVYTTNSESTPPPPVPQADTYEQAIAAYDAGEYTDAEALFNTLVDYEDSSKYLRLIRIRSAGSNEGMGVKLYKKELGLTDADKKDIEEAAADFDFADTAKVLLCNSDVASFYLTGLWSGGSRSYLYFKMEETGGSYSIGSKLSAMKHTNYAISEGKFYVDGPEDVKTAILGMTLTGPDTMEVVTYEKDNQSYTLNRNTEKK